MIQYLLSAMKGQNKSFFAQFLIYLLLPWTFFYGIGVFCHRSFFRLQGAFKAPKPVISIGNITVGGVGKTPLVIWLACNLQYKGYKSVILTRGYMPDKTNDSDEVDMLNEQIPYIPVLAGANRIKNITTTEHKFPLDVYIADDAFQHWPLHRDLDIVAIDAGNPFGNGFLLPAGVLREGLSALKRADILVLTKTNSAGDLKSLSAKLAQINPKALIVETRYESSALIDVFSNEASPIRVIKDKRVIGFCAIGDPLSFECELKNTEAKIVEIFTYMDHHVYHKEEIVRMIGSFHSHHADIFVTTHKDAVKLREFKELFNGIQLMYVPIQLEITKGADEFIQKVISVFHH